MDRRSTTIAAVGVAGLAVAGLAVGWAMGLRPPAEGVGTVAPAAPSVPQEQAHSRDIGDRTAARPGAPNVVLLFGCTVRRDQLTPYGGPEQTTPFLAEFAASGVQFDDAIAASSWTKATTTAVITGQHPLSLGLPDPKRTPSRRVLPEQAVTVAERLAERGYMTLGVTANPNLNHEVGMAQGMDRYRDSQHKGFALKNKIVGRDVVRLALELLDERTEAERERPFYLRLMMIDTHTPRNPRRPEVQRFAEPGLPLLVSQYRALLRRVDEATRTLDTELASRGYDPSNTLVVFVADHGEGLSYPEHHRGGHGKGMYGTTVRVPWMMRGPGVPPGGQVRGMVSQVDLLPTLMGLLDDPIDPGAEGLPGRDWSELVRVGAGTADRDRAFAASMFHGANVASIWTPERQCQRDYGTLGTDDFPLIEGCFDRAADPEFTQPFDDAALLAELEAWREARLAEFETHPVVEWDPNDDVARQLEALGYVEGADE